MTRKRFVKSLMALNYSKNQIEKIINHNIAEHKDYAVLFANIIAQDCALCDSPFPEFAVCIFVEVNLHWNIGKISKLEKKIA